MLCGNVHGCDSLGDGGTVPNGGRVAESRHYPYGAVRWTWTADGSGTLPTDYRFTGQRDVGLGLTHMGARFLDSALGRWTSADTIVPEPGNPQSLNRYTWVLNQPLRFTDPTGHFEKDELQELLGFQDDPIGFSTWWDSLSEDLIKFLLDANWGDMLSFVGHYKAGMEASNGQWLGFEYDQRYELIFAQEGSSGKLTFWDNTHGVQMDFFDGVKLWEMATLSSGDKGEFVPFRSSRHPWRGEARDRSGADCYIFYDDEFRKGQSEAAMIGLGLMVTFYAPEFVDKTWALVGSAITAWGLYSAANSNDNPIPYVWAGTLYDRWWAEVHAVTW